MNIIDIRSRDLYLKGHIPGAIYIDMYDLINNPDNYLNKNEVYHIYCSNGISSQSVVSMLNKMGYNTVNIDGGYNKLSSSR